MEEDSNKKNNLYLRFTSVVIQMGVVIGGFSWLGVYLDNRQHLETPIWTIILSLLGVFISMYMIFKEVKNINKD
ncbi:MAG: AtpZ/AtpI family protein [Bacteroidota bacterium]